MTLKELQTQYSLITPATAGAFIKAIHTANNDSQIKSQDLIACIDSIIRDFQDEGRRICLQSPDLSAADRETLTCHGKIIAAYVLLSHASRYTSETRAKTLLFLEYASAIVRSSYDFVKTATAVVCYPITATGLDWKAVQDAQSLDMLCYKMISGIRFDRSRGEIFQYTDRGRAVCKDGVLSVFSADVGEAGARAFTLYGGSVEVVTRNSRDEKLRSSCQRDAAAVGEFAQTFLKAQLSFVKAKPAKREYSSGDTVDIVVTSGDEKSLYCKILDFDDPIGGLMVNEELIRGTTTEDIIPYLFAGDVIRGAKLIMDEDGVRFSIREPYCAYALSAARLDDKEDTVFEAKVTHIREDIGRINWITPRGYGAVSYPVEGETLRVGDIHVMSIYNIQTNGSATYINICPPKMGYDTIDIPFDDSDDGKDGILEGFVATQEDVLKERTTAEPEQQSGSAETLRALASMIANRAAFQPSMERYESLLAALFLRTVSGETDPERKLEKAAYLLRMKLTFAQGHEVPATHPYVYTGDDANLLALLSESTRPDGTLMGTVSSLPEGTQTRQIGELLLGLWLSAEHCDELKAVPEVIRERVCGLLGVQDEYRMCGTDRTGKYGQAETHDVEFKSSYVFRNDGGGADIDRQGRGEVFQAVCGFLNAEGGTLYLGVNDAGMPIRSKEYGLQADMDWLSANYQTVNAARLRQLGHPTMKADTLDHYVLFLNDEKAIYFKESLLGNITIEVTEDADAIRITARPSEYEIAYLYADATHQDGAAFVRDGGRTVPMSRLQKERRLTSLKRISKEMGFVVTIQEAIDQHRKLVFRDYASGNSGKVKDRFVVPVKLFYNDENVYCFDLESHTYKQFRLKRISSIDLEVDNPVYTLPLTAPKGVDVFRWLDEGGRRYHVKLRMGVSAKNYLLEEYSCAEKLPKEELYPEKKDQWILDTHVNGLGAVRRFYLGLADKIEILDTEDSDVLKEEIRRFVAENISGR